MNINFHGSDWAQIENWLAEELLNTYRRLANPASTAAETEQLRGRALLISQLLDLPNNPAAPSR